MNVAISGSVGSGKSSIANLLKIKLRDAGFNFGLVELKEFAFQNKISYNKELKTTDFDLDKTLVQIENFLKKNENNLILESHFSHFINPKYLNLLFVLGRDLKDLKKVYLLRGYGNLKIEQNLEVEAFNLCYFEAIENGFVEGKNLYFVENNLSIEGVSNIIFNIVVNFLEKD